VKFAKHDIILDGAGVEYLILAVGDDSYFIRSLQPGQPHRETCWSFTGPQSADAQCTLVEPKTAVDVLLRALVAPTAPFLAEANQLINGARSEWSRELAGELELILADLAPDRTTRPGLEMAVNRLKNAADR
jgi:hypothetical protein